MGMAKDVYLNLLADTVIQKKKTCSVILCPREQRNVPTTLFLSIYIETFFVDVEFCCKTFSPGFTKTLSHREFTFFGRNDSR